MDTNANLPRPYGLRILVKLDPKREKTDGGILIPETVQQRAPTLDDLPTPEIGTVKAIGDGIVTDNGTRLVCTLKPGQRVAFMGMSSIVIKHAGEFYCILSERDVLAVVGDESTLSVLQ